MAFWFLPNTTGHLATTFTLGGGAGTVAAYPMTNLISGPRSTMWQRDTFAIGEERFNYATDPTGVAAADLFVTHVVLARMDLAVRNSAGYNTFRVRYLPGSSGAIATAVAAVGVVSADLTGVRSQDYVSAFSRLGGTFWEVRNLFLANNQGMMSKVYCSDGFNLNTDPLPNPTWNILTEPQYVTPMRGTRPYEVEAFITMSWRHVTLAKLTAFKAISQLYYHPLFLYDDATNVIPWKLEHVLVTGWTETIEHVDSWSLTVNFARLRHYD